MTMTTDPNLHRDTIKGAVFFWKTAKNTLQKPKVHKAEVGLRMQSGVRVRWYTRQRWARRWKKAVGSESDGGDQNPTVHSNQRNGGRQNLKVAVKCVTYTDMTCRDKARRQVTCCDLIYVYAFNQPYLFILCGIPHSSIYFCTWLSFDLFRSVPFFFTDLVGPIHVLGIKFNHPIQR